MPDLRRVHPECRQVVRHYVRRPRQIHSARRRQIQHSRHRFYDLIFRPARHAQKPLRLCCLRHGKLRRRAQLPRLRLQFAHLRRRLRVKAFAYVVRLRQRLDTAHLVLEVLGVVYRRFERRHDRLRRAHCCLHVFYCRVKITSGLIVCRTRIQHSIQFLCFGRISRDLRQQPQHTRSELIRRKARLLQRILHPIQQCCLPRCCIRTVRCLSKYRLIFHRFVLQALQLVQSNVQQPAACL